VHLVSPEGVESLPAMGKGEVAIALITRFAETLSRPA